jgi:hypothetical protein
MSERVIRNGKMGDLMRNVVGEEMFVEDPEVDWEKAASSGSLVLSAAEYRELEGTTGIDAVLLAEIIPPIPVADLGDDPYEYVKTFCRRRVAAAAASAASIVADIRRRQEQFGVGQPAEPS